MEFHQSSGNVFRDLDFDRAEAENLRVRADLMIRLRAFIKEEGLTQKQAAELFGMHQPRVSALMRGKIDEFSIDALVNMLACAGLEVTIDIKPRAA